MAAEANTDLNKPPFFKTWKPLYWLVLGALVLQIIIYYAITQHFA